MPFLEVGKIGLPGGPVWAASDHLSVKVKGSMTHGAYPQNGNDPIVALSQMISSLQTVTSRNVDARDAAVVSVCRVEGGSAYNIIPDHVECEGMIRTLDADVRSHVHDRVRQICSGVATALGCEAEVGIRRGSYLTANALALESFMGEAINRSGSSTEAVPFQPQMGAEDFCAFSRRVPSAYLFLGVRNEELGIVHALHTPEFDVDEDCIEPGVQAMCDALIEAAQNWKDIEPNLEVPEV
jgi:amidohydrolase